MRVVFAAIGKSHVAGLISRKSQVYDCQGESASMKVLMPKAVPAAAAAKMMTLRIIFPAFVIDPDMAKVALAVKCIR
jgi:hypothetical protein